MHTDADFSLPVSTHAPLLFDPERGFNDNSPLVQNALRAAKRGWRMAVELYNPSKHCVYLALPTTDGEKPPCARILIRPQKALIRLLQH